MSMIFYGSIEPYLYIEPLHLARFIGSHSFFFAFLAARFTAERFSLDKGQRPKLELVATVIVAEKCKLSSALDVVWQTDYIVVRIWVHIFEPGANKRNSKESNIDAYPLPT